MHLNKIIFKALVHSQNNNTKKKNKTFQLLRKMSILCLLAGKLSLKYSDEMYNFFLLLFFFFRSKSVLYSLTNCNFLFIGKKNDEDKKKNEKFGQNRDDMKGQH